MPVLLLGLIAKPIGMLIASLLGNLLSAMFIRKVMIAGMEEMKAHVTNVNAKAIISAAEEAVSQPVKGEQVMSKSVQKKVSENIKAMYDSGADKDRPRDQIIAIAFSKAREAAAAKKKLTKSTKKQ